jgi:hypothetical protein
MENEPLLEDIVFKIKTNSLHLNYKYNSIDGSLSEYLTFSFKNVPVVGDVIDFEQYYDDGDGEKLAAGMLLDFKTATFQVVERGCWMGNLKFPVSAKQDHWLISLEPCFNFKTVFRGLFISEIGGELIKNFTFSDSTCEALKELGLYDSITLDYLAEKYDSIKSDLADEILLEISNLIEFYIPIKKENEKYESFKIKLHTITENFK